MEKIDYANNIFNRTEMPTRAELLGLKEEQKRMNIMSWINDLIRHVKHVALTDDKTSVSYCIVEKDSMYAKAAIPAARTYHEIGIGNRVTQLCVIYPMADILPYIKNEFPDCIVTYEEVWNEVRPGLKQSSNILTIDWS